MNDNEGVSEFKPIEEIESNLIKMYDIFLDLVILEEKIGDEYWSYFNRLSKNTSKLLIEYQELNDNILKKHSNLYKLIE